MYPAKFNYYRASSVDEAVSLLQEHGEEAKVLAGGHSLLPMMKLRLAQPAVLIDIGRIDDLRGITPLDGGGIRIGAMTTYAEIAANETLRGDPRFGALVDACALIGDAQVRNRGTIGGNLSHNDPASDLPAVALALAAELEVVGPGGQRLISADDFIVGLMATALDPDEIVTGVRFLDDHLLESSAYEKFENPASGYAICGVAAAINSVATRGGPRATARVAVNGALDHAQRLSAVEETLAQGGDLHDLPVAEAAEKATEGLSEFDFLEDIHADGAYRAHLMKVLTRRALQKALFREEDPFR